MWHFMAFTICRSFFPWKNHGFPHGLFHPPPMGHGPPSRGPDRLPRTATDRPRPAAPGATPRSCPPAPQ